MNKPKIPFSRFESERILDTFQIPHKGLSDHEVKIELLKILEAGKLPDPNQIKQAYKKFD